MKLENNNKQIIKRITNSSLKYNKLRNIVVVIAIVLTTFMISSVFSIGASLIKNYHIMSVRLAETTANVYLPNPREEQIKAIEKLGISDSVGKEILVGQIVKKDIQKSKGYVFLKYYDKENWQKQITPAIGDVKGNYPIKENEVMMSKKALELLGKDESKIGDKIKLSYRGNEGSKIKKEFVLSGIYTTYGLKLDTGYIAVSEKFIKSNNLNILDNGILSFTLKNNKKNEAPDLLESNVDLDEGQLYQYCYDIDQDSKEMAKSSVAVIGTIGLFIVFSGYLLIYNIMHIAVTKDIHFYGLMKTIGTSPKQIKKIVKGQVFRLSTIGIPIGLILGFVVSFILLPMLISTVSSGTDGNAMPSEISFSPLIFICATLFSLFTISLSCRKPAKIAGNISPTESLRYSGSKGNKQKKDRKSTNGGKLYKMAWYNVFRDKKRAILVFASLFIGIITYLSVNTFLDCIGMENYINNRVRNDFEIQNRKAVDGKINDRFIKEIQNMDGVKSVSNFKLSNLQRNINEIPDPMAQYGEKYGEDSVKLLDEAMRFHEGIEKDHSAYVSPITVGVDDLAIEKYNDKNNVKIDVEAFKTGKLALVDSNHFSKEKNKCIIDKNFTKENIVLRGKHKNSLNFNVTQIVKDYNFLLPDTGSPTVYISLHQLEKLDKNAVNYTLHINVDKKYEKAINSDIKKMTKDKNLFVISKSEEIKALKHSERIMDIIGGGMSIVLILIGLLNFINVMVTGINIRLKELAVMESIGMTKNQIKKMLTLEGTYYAGITTLLVSTLGMTIVFTIGKMAKKIANYAEFIFPTVTLISLAILIFAVCLITPSIAYKYSSKKSVTERLK
ncbi:FtsX-like permease family protein [Romboutsia sedimentorum]|uniref:ABC transporter permease n=1 Tax=Romboutsia sedimentorum TaxID=1368474 RepID=UPI0024DEEC31|nr:ABC transporter permease [Romboutsia sedimentorum]MDK2586062.1 FtsX-like permease family protein [Romboutsia sedimentorum]